MCFLGENYVEAVSPALALTHWYSMFFISCQLIGLFFITALLIEAFCASYEKNHVHYLVQDHAPQEVAVAYSHAGDMLL